ncbi:MerR family transcriptional regulator [Actinophytocola xinjiangensis]|jgi:DNA-binding transcriptional MerR regulator|uniref:MerR family transcriptional regulator n=1 Tax=Actinophytocola xinjiangensis TaxID=485602 RepID=A0A7Z1AZI6_9PSEU|nr:MerR family transcriptional regulator [Actinophytocola xinjiangensis]OLF11108.1 MerR family transcriptional regulator [Actinophytocola xinjiangensis]
MTAHELTIGEVADRFGLPTHVLRHWEAEGLLRPDRTASTHRRYGTDDLYRIASILNAKEAGLSLPDIRALLTATDPVSRKEVLARQRRLLAERLARTTAALRLVEGAIECTHEDITTCPNYRARVDLRLRESAHVTG